MCYCPITDDHNDLKTQKMKQDKNISINRIVQYLKNKYTLKMQEKVMRTCDIFAVNN